MNSDLEKWIQGQVNGYQVNTQGNDVHFIAGFEASMLV